MVQASGASQSRQWGGGNFPSRVLTQVMVQDADLLVPTCHRAEFPWPLCTQPLLVQPQMGKASAVLRGCLRQVWERVPYASWEH